MEKQKSEFKRKKPKKSAKPKQPTQKQSQKQSVVINLTELKNARRKRASKKSKATPMPASQRSLVSAEQQQQFVYVPPRYASDISPAVIQRQNVLNPNSQPLQQWDAQPVLNATNQEQVASQAPAPTLKEQVKMSAEFIDKMRRESVIETERLRRNAETEAIAEQMRRGLMEPTPRPLAPMKPPPSPLAVPPPLTMAERLLVGQNEGGRRKKVEVMEAQRMGAQDFDSDAGVMEAKRLAREFKQMSAEDRLAKPKSGRKAKAPAMAPLQENEPMSSPLMASYAPAQMLFSAQPMSRSLSASSSLSAMTDAEIGTPRDEDEPLGMSSGKKMFDFI